MSARSGNGASSRINLPNDVTCSAIRADGRSPGGEVVEVDKEIGEGCEFIKISSDLFLLNLLRLDAVKHAKFVRAHGRHCSDEAETMKVSIARVNHFFHGCLCSFY
jgi:hypothetical protein